MSLPVVIAALSLIILAGCTLQPQSPLETSVEVNTCSCSQLQKWLDLERKVSRMSTERVERELTLLGKPEGWRQQFYFGLLHQQLDVFASWTQARDAFRGLSEDVGLSRERRDLAAILQRYNQTRINWSLKYRQLLEDNGTVKDKLRASQEENELLENKLQAITDLETSISTRKE